MTNLKRLIACLEREVEQYGSKHFNIIYLAYYPDFKALNRYDNGFNDVNALHQCGSTACAIGIWNTYHPRECLFFNDDHLITGEGDVDVAHWLGMDEDQRERLLTIFGFPVNEYATTCEASETLYGVNSLEDVRLEQVVAQLKALEAECCS